jgi:phage baseplate assembly protein W
MPLYGPKFPLKAGDHDTFELYDDVKQQINFYLKNLLLTSPGENLSDSGYGVGLRRFLFEQNVDSVRARMVSSISSQISKYLPYLTVEDIQTGATTQEIDNNTMFVRVVYSIPGDVVQEIFELNLSPETTIGFY